MEAPVTGTASAEESSPEWGESTTPSFESIGCYSLTVDNGRLVVLYPLPPMTYGICCSPLQLPLFLILASFQLLPWYQLCLFLFTLDFIWMATLSNLIVSPFISIIRSKPMPPFSFLGSLIKGSVTDSRILRTLLPLKDYCIYCPFMPFISCYLFVLTLFPTKLFGNAI